MEAGQARAGTQMIRPANQPESQGSESSPLELLRTARADLVSIPPALEEVLEALTEEDLEVVQPPLAAAMRNLLEAARIISDVADALKEDMEANLMNELQDAERVLSKRLLDFRRAMGSGSADTIRQSLRVDLMESANHWSRLLDGVTDQIEAKREDH